MDTSSKHKINHEQAVGVLSYILLTLVITLGFVFWVGITKSDIFNYPIEYGTGDIAVVLYRSHEMRLDNAILAFDQLGAPDYSNTYNYYAFDILILVIQYIFAKITPSYIIGFNFFVLGGSYFNGISSLYAFRRLGFRRLTSVAPAVVMAATPFYFFRALGHTYLSYYFAVPIACVLAIEIANGSYASLFDKSNDLKKRISNLLLLIIIGCSGMYYVYFSAFFFLIALIYRLFNQRSHKEVVSALQAIGISTITMIIAAIPYIHNVINGTTGILASARIGSAPDAADNLSLHFMSLILPVVGHRIPALSAIRDNYLLHTCGEEADVNCLGFILAICLFSIPILVIVRKFRTELFSILLTFISVALFISLRSPINKNIIYIVPYIRCYNRISIYLSFLSSVVLAYVLDKITVKIIDKHSKRVAVLLEVIIILFVCNFAYWDQAGKDQFPTDDIIVTSKTLFDEESAFVDSFSTDKEQNIYIIPYEDFPEGLPQNELRANDLFSLVVHSNTINISFGSIPGTESYDNLNAIAYENIESQVRFALSEGYNGVILAKPAFQAETQEIVINEISTLLGSPAASSSRFVYWSIQ